jgi:hypothetical protein
MGQVGQSAKCVNFDYGHDDVNHRMRTVYVRGSLSPENQHPDIDNGNRAMKAIGFYCFRCKTFWTFGKVRRIYEERSRLERLKPNMYTRPYKSNSS